MSAPDWTSMVTDHVRQAAQHHTAFVDKQLSELDPGQTLCVHEATDFDFGDKYTVTWRMHVLAEAEECGAHQRRQQYGPAPCKLAHHSRRGVPMSTPEPRKRDLGLDITLILMVMLGITGAALTIFARLNPLARVTVFWWGIGLTTASIVIFALVGLRVASVVGKRR
jgi:hypothetical protein